MTYYGIFVNGELDCDPDPMIFRTYTGAVEFIEGSSCYDPDLTDIHILIDADAARILHEYGTEAGE